MPPLADQHLLDLGDLVRKMAVDGVLVAQVVQVFLLALQEDGILSIKLL
jgi:hypothetical protein